MADLQADTAAIGAAGQVIGEVSEHVGHLGEMAAAAVQHSIDAAGHPMMAAELTQLLSQFGRVHVATAESLGQLARQLLVTGTVIDETDANLGSAAEEVGAKASASHVSVREA